MCMFWTACDVFKLRLEQKRVDEAVKIYEALRRLLPRIEEIEASDDQAASKREESPAKEQAHHKGQARGFMKFAEGRLIKESEKFRKRYFAIRDKKKHEKSETLISTNEPLINEKFVVHSWELYVHPCSFVAITCSSRI